MVQELLPRQTLAHPRCGVVEVLRRRVVVPPVFHLADVFFYVLNGVVESVELVSCQRDSFLPGQLYVTLTDIVLSDVNKKDVLCRPDAYFNFFLVTKVVSDFSSAF